MLMQRTSILIVAILAGLALAYGIVWYLEGGISKQAQIKEGEMRADSMRVETAAVREDADTYTIDAQYPQFGAPAIDTAIASFFRDAIAQFKMDAAESPPFPLGTQYELTSIFNGVYIGEDIISARLIVSTYMGGAHPVSFAYGLNFDRATGRELTLSDALSMISMSLEQVSTRTISELNAQFDERVFFAEGAVAKPENYSTFAIDESTVTFIFQPYQVAPYAAGLQEVSFKRR